MKLHMNYVTVDRTNKVAVSLVPLYPANWVKYLRTKQEILNSEVKLNTDNKSLMLIILEIMYDNELL